MRNKILTRIIITTLLVAFLTISVGRVSPVFAMAAFPIGTVQPVYDTEIIALYDYVSENLDQPQLDIFFFLGGALAVSQLGAQDVLLESPYPNESSVKEWFINCGIQLYNSLIGLVPEGDYYMGIPISGIESRIHGIPREKIRALTAQLLGNAVVARNYPDLDNFLNDDDSVLMPFHSELQLSINAIWQLEGGPYHWQFDSSPFVSSKTYQTTNIPALSNYYTLVNQLAQPHIKVNYNNIYNALASSSFFNEYNNLFFNTSTNRVSFASDSGEILLNTGSYFPNIVFYRNGSGIMGESNFTLKNANYSSVVFDTYVELVQYVIDTPNFMTSGLDLFLTDFIDHYYFGSNWLDKQEIFNISNLNISDVMNDYYESPVDNVFIDIKNMLRDLVDNTDIWNTIINNIYDSSGNHIIDMPTIRVSVDLTPITELIAPPIPVNLNDIAELTDNTYLDSIKDHSRNFGESIGEWFVFWHNCDTELVYVFFGSVIVILVGAFIGKWGHS